MNNQEQTFAQNLQILVAAFVSEGHAEETDAEVADAILEFVLTHERLRRQVTAGTNEAKEVDAQTIAKMRSWDSNDSAMSTLEKVLHRLAGDRGADGIRLLKDAINASALAVSKKQASVAKLPRKSRQQPMSGLVEQIVRQDPEIKQQQLLFALKRQLASMADPPYRYSGNSFKPTDGELLTIDYSAMADYLYRAKQKLSP